MKKENEVKTQSVESLIQEYAHKVSDHAELIKDIESKISECDSQIDKLNEEINKGISNFTPEEYIAIQSEVNKLRLTKEMHEKRLSMIRGDLKGFSSIEEKRDFINRFRTSFNAEEEEFIKACDKHLKALGVLLSERTYNSDKAVALAQSLNEMNIVYPSNVRKIVSRTLSARNNIGSYTI